MRLRTRVLTGIAVAMLAVAGFVMPATPASAHCGGHGTHPDLYSDGGVRYAAGTNIRTHPHISCTARGQGQRSHGIDVHCATLHSNGWLWIYARDTTTGVNGWSREDAMRYPNGTAGVFIHDCNGSGIRWQPIP